MTAQELWKEGRLDEAIGAQVSEVKADPTNPEKRYLLFALVCYSGDLEKAALQLDAIGVQDEKLQTGTLIYFNLLASEAERRRVHSGEGKPLVSESADAALLARVEAMGAWGRGERVTAVERLAKASETENSIRVRVDGTEFDGVEDTDELLGTCLEVFAGGCYLLLPFRNLRLLELSEPKHLLDLLWVPAQLEDAEGSAANVHLPVLYAGSYSAKTPLQLGRGTEWSEEDGVVRGYGQKMLAFGGGSDPDDRALLSVRRFELVSGEG